VLPGRRLNVGSTFNTGRSQGIRPRARMIAMRATPGTRRSQSTVGNRCIAVIRSH
jgi:hypothetical protein